jgi:hypothetical protein
MPENRTSLPRWTEVVDSVHETLARAEAEVSRLEAAADAAVPPPDANRSRGWQEVPPEPAAAELDGCLTRAAQVASSATAALQNAEESLRRWLAQAEAQRCGLVKEGPHSL